jgi:hypothetical protein
MRNEKITDRQQRLEEFLHAVEAAQKLQDDILRHGLDAAYLYVEDVDGDWLERWGEDEEEQQKIIDVTTFLKSDDWLAVRIREQIQDTLLCRFAVEVEKCLLISDPQERLIEVKKILSVIITNGDSNCESNPETDESKLLYLAQELLNKLEEI